MTVARVAGVQLEVRPFAEGRHEDARAWTGDGECAFADGISVGESVAPGEPVAIPDAGDNATARFFRKKIQIALP